MHTLTGDAKQRSDGPQRRATGGALDLIDGYRTCSTEQLAIFRRLPHFECLEASHRILHLEDLDYFFQRVGVGVRYFFDESFEIFGHVAQEATLTIMENTVKHCS
jgi:hypothetical protein